MSDITSSKQYADVGDAVTLTCAYTDPASITPTVTWYKDTTPTTTGVEADGDGKSLIKFASIAVGDNAAYKCKVDYASTYGDYTATALSQYARSIDTKVTGTQYALIGTAVTHTCEVHGDALTGDVVWKNTGGALTAGYTQNTVGYSNFKTTSTLVIAAQAAADTTTFTCEVEYTQGPTATSATIDASTLGEYGYEM